MTTLIPKFDLQNGGSTPTGAINRTIYQKLSDIVSVKDFGAVGDGTTDDTTAINNALAANSAIYFPAGTYLVSGNINIQNKSLIGFNARNTTIQLSGTNTNTPVFVNSATSSSSWGSGGGFEMYSLTVSGNWDGSTANPISINTFDSLGSIVKWYQGAYVKIENCVIQNSFAHALGFYNLGYSQIQFNHIQTNKYNGIHLQGVSSAAAITSTWVSNNSVNSCRGTAAIYLNEGLTCQVTQNVLEDCANGFYVDGNDNRTVAFDFNDMEQMSGSGVYIAGSGQNFSIQNNYLGVTTPITVSNISAASGIFNNNSFAGTNYATAYPTLGTGAASDYTFKIFGLATTGTSPGSIQWLSNNNLNAALPIGQIRAIQTGTVNQVGGSLVFSTGNLTTTTDYTTLDSAGNWYPNIDNTQKLGTASNRWSVVYAGTGTINTSDANQKQQFESLTAAEQATAKAIKTLIKTFKFNDSVAKKSDKARKHVGVSAQDVQAAFTANGLNADEYALFCSDTWYVDAEGNIYQKNVDTEGKAISGLTPVTQLGVRYEELLAFVIAAL